MNWLLIIVGMVFLICMIVGYSRGFIKIVVSLAATVATVALVIALSPYTSGVIASLTPVDEMVQEKCVKILAFDSVGDAEGAAEMPRQKQIEMIETTNMPAFLKEGLLANNNSEAYARLGVSRFQEYVGAYIADIVVKMIAFLLTFIIVTILIRAIIFALDIVTALPIIKGFNRIAGIAAGAAIGVILVWVGFFVITLIYDTPIGRDCFIWIEESEFLTFLYNENVILSLATKLR